MLSNTWTPQNSAPRRYLWHTPGQRRNGPHSREIPANGPSSQIVNGHWEIRVGGLSFSGLAATSFPGWWQPALPGGARLGLQWDHPLAGEGLGEPVGVALGHDEVGVMQQLSVAVSV